MSNTIETSSSFSIHPTNPIHSAMLSHKSLPSAVRTSPLSLLGILILGHPSNWSALLLMRNGFQTIIFSTICSTEVDECSLFLLSSSSVRSYYCNSIPTQQMISFLIAQSHTMIAIIIIVLLSGQSTFQIVLLLLVGGGGWCWCIQTQFNLCGWKL